MNLQLDGITLGCLDTNTVLEFLKDCKKNDITDSVLTIKNVFTLFGMKCDLTINFNEKFYLTGNKE